MRTRCARKEPSRTRAANAGRVVPAPPTAPARRLRLLPFDGARERGDVVLDEEGVDEGDGDGAQERAGHERAPVEDVAAHELGKDPDRNRLLLGRREKDERVEELVPGQGEGEDPRREDPGNGER